MCSRSTRLTTAAPTAGSLVLITNRTAPPTSSYVDLALQLTSSTYPFPVFLKLNKGALPVLAISHGCDKRQLTRTASLSLVWTHRPPQLGRRGNSHGCRSTWLKRLTSGWTREQKEMDAGPCLAFSFFSFWFSWPQLIERCVYVRGESPLLVIVSRRTFTATP